MTARIIPLHPDAPAALPTSEPVAPVSPELAAEIAAANAGDAQAAHALVLRILPRVRNLVRYLVRGDDIEDFSQDALLKILERLSSFRGDGRFEAWVDGVTMRVTLRKLQKKRNEMRRFPASEVDELASVNLWGNHGGNPPSPRYLARRRAVEALDKLPDAQRIALVMHHVLGMTVTEIASELAAPPETIRSRLRVGMGQVRALLGALREGEA
jgi:RNA polymerase sigma-70 factor (ECF subfamily)